MQSTEPLERSLSNFLDVRGPAVQAGLLPVFDLESELRGNRHFASEWSQRFAHQIFIRERAVYLRRVEKCDVPLDRCPDKRDSLLPIYGWTVAIAHSHASEPDSRNFQAASSKFALLHCSSSP